MTQAELLIRLKAVGYPVAYHHFRTNDKKPPPGPPYVVYFRTGEANIASDATVHGKLKSYRVEIYTEQRDPAAEKKMEDILKVIDPGYGTEELYIESEDLYLVAYEITLVEK